MKWYLEVNYCSSHRLRWGHHFSILFVRIHYKLICSCLSSAEHNNKASLKNSNERFIFMTESTRQAEKKDLSPVASHGTLQHWWSSPKIITATCTPQGTFLTRTLSTFCHKNKPFVVVLQRGFVILFSAT